MHVCYNVHVQVFAAACLSCEIAELTSLSVVNFCLWHIIRIIIMQFVKNSENVSQPPSPFTPPLLPPSLPSFLEDSTVRRALMKWMLKYSDV